MKPPCLRGTGSYQVLWKASEYVVVTFQFLRYTQVNRRFERLKFSSKIRYLTLAVWLDLEI